ncbi:perilipin-3-like [Lithobates pipiens]
MAERGQVDENQNAHVSIFHRLASFPLVQSAYQIASFAYRDVKAVNPAVGYFCEVSERGVKVASDLATFGVAPLLKVMEPQITAINNVALQLVDGLENKLPVLDQPADEVVSEIRENVVSGVRRVGARALERVQKVVDRTRAVARESYEVLSITTTFLATLEVQDMVKVATYFVLTQAEELVDRYLPEESDGETMFIIKGWAEGTGSPGRRMYRRDEESHKLFLL